MNKNAWIYFATIVTTLFISASGNAEISAEDQEIQCKRVAVTAAAKTDLESDFRHMDFSSRNRDKKKLDWGIKLKSVRVKAKRGYRTGDFNTFMIRFVSGVTPVHPESNVDYEVTTQWTKTGCIALDLLLISEE